MTSPPPVSGDGVLAKEREAVITCEFCRARYVVTEPELRDIERRLLRHDAADG